VRETGRDQVCYAERRFSPAYPLSYVVEAILCKTRHRADGSTRRHLRTAIRRRDVFVSPSWRYADPRFGLLTGGEWDTARPIICRTLGFTSDPAPVLSALAQELDQTYRSVAARLPNNSAVRFETVDGRKELVLSPFDKLEEPPSLLALRDAVAARLPRVDLPEILLEIAARTGFTDAFTHITERTARAADLSTSLCAVLLAEACNTGPEPLVHNDIPAFAARSVILGQPELYPRRDLDRC
jgi:hypothetical protein